MKWLVLGAFLLPFAGAADAACPDGSLMHNAARGWIAGQRLIQQPVALLAGGGLGRRQDRLQFGLQFGRGLLPQSLQGLDQGLRIAQPGQAPA